jgi:hypothetical protein
MADRLVTNTRKGYDGDILCLCNPKESWSPRFKNDAIKEIENNIHNYFIISEDNQISIKVILKNGSKHLVAMDQSTNNNILDNLTNC